MSLRRTALALATAGIAGALALSIAPATAQETSAEATFYRFSIPGTVKPGATKLSVPGDVKAKKSRGGKDLGKVSLADVVETLTDQAAKGRSVGGTITIKGVTRPWRGLPVLMDDGTVKIRVAQGRGSRVIVLPRGGGAATGGSVSCPPGTTATYDSKSGKYTCK
ncbi:MAG: hypothetical protein RL347_1261 [Actinomycetota bacterium]|jgi:hypothetical protein